MDVQLKDFEDFRRPSRKPWLFLLAFVVIGAIVLQRWLHKPTDNTQEDLSGVGETNRPAEIVQSAGTPPRPTGNIRNADGGAGTSTSKPISRETRTESAGHVGSEAGTESTKQVIPAPNRASIPNSSLGKVLEMGKALELQNDLLGARRIYLAALDGKAAESKQRRDIEDRLGIVNILLVTGALDMPEKEEYIVKAGDSLEKIAKSLGTTEELIQKSNGLANPNKISKGARFRILKGRFSVAVSKGVNEMVVSLDGKFFKRYAVGTGKNSSTPEGTFVISYKEKEPVWWKDNKDIPFGHPENILGTRWMGLKSTGNTPDYKSYGLHGTWDNSTIGKPLSAGCVRMKNSDVEELFMLLPTGVPVTIAP